MSEMVRLRRIMEQLRGPDGCPWDREQTLESLRTYLVEEAHEVIEAIDAGSLEALREELGDLLLQIIFQARVAEERGAFDMESVMRGIGDKIVSRHPHVFASGRLDNADQVLRQWEQLKADERRGRKDASMFAGVPGALPALLKALRISSKAARVGFDWSDAAGVWTKIEEEMAELGEAVRRGDREAVAEEIGDLLFTIATWPGMRRSIRSRRCRPPTGNSSSASATWRRRWPGTARARRPRSGSDGGAVGGGEDRAQKNFACPKRPIRRNLW